MERTIVFEHYPHPEFPGQFIERIAAETISGTDYASYDRGCECKLCAPQLNNEQGKREI